MKTQQCCVLASALGTIIVGIALVSVSRFLLSADVVLRNLEPSFGPAVFALGVSVCFIGAIGTCGSCLSSRIALSVYGLGDLLTALAGLVLGGSLLFMANMHSIDIVQSCSLFQQSGQSSSALGKQYQESYDKMKQALQNCRRNGRAGALGLQDCGRLGRDNNGNWYQQDPRREMLSWIEAFSGCGGFCAGDMPLFGFPAPGGQATDQSSKTSLRDPCYKSLAGELQVRGSANGVIITVLSLPLVVAVCGAAWTLCYPPLRARKDYFHPADFLRTSDDDHLESDRLLSHARGTSPENSDDE